VEQNVIVKSGSWFSYREERIGQGRDAVKKYLLENEKSLRQVETETRSKLGLPVRADAAADKGNSAGQPKAAPGQAKTETARALSPATAAKPEPAKAEPAKRGK
jgi:recombination protein RecA